MSLEAMSHEDRFRYLLRSRADWLRSVAGILDRAHGLAERNEMDSAMDLGHLAEQELRALRKTLTHAIEDWSGRDVPEATVEQVGDFARERAERRHRRYLARKHGGRGGVVALVPPVKPNGEGSQPEGEPTP